MGVSIQDRTDFLNMLDACRTEQQLFSRLTFAVMFHQTDPAAREDLLDDVRGAACNMQLPAVNYKSINGSTPANRRGRPTPQPLWQP